MRVPPWLRGLLLLAVSAGLLAFVLSRVDLGGVAATFAGADLFLLGSATAFSITAFALLPTLRWQGTLSAMGFRLPLGALMFARFGSQPLKVTIPFKGGEAFRALWLRRREGVPMLLGVASILFDMFLVGVGQLTFLCVGLALGGVAFEHALLPTLALLGVALLLTSRSVQALALRIARALSRRLEDKLSQLAHGFLRFPAVTKLRLVLLSYAVEFSEIFSMFLCARALGVDLPMSAVLTYMPIVMGITLIPVTISGFGTRELAIVLLFSAYAGEEQLTSVALLFTAVEFVLPALVGCAFLSSFLSGLAANSVGLRDPGSEPPGALDIRRARP